MRILLLAIGLSASAQTGKTAFQARCAGCHGDDGTGTGRGSNIVAVRRRAPDQPSVRDLIRKGIPGGGMPAFTLPDEELEAITSFVMSLRTAAVTNDTRPGATIRLHDGRIVRGLVRNESAFDLQLLGDDGRLHLLLKNQIAEITREEHPWSETTPVAGGIPYADIANPKFGSWPTYHGNQSGNRFSPLNQINASNV